jgi:hypothetical protein
VVLEDLILIIMEVILVVVVVVVVVVLHLILVSLVLVEKLYQLHIMEGEGYGIGGEEEEVAGG